MDKESPWKNSWAFNGSDLKTIPSFLNGDVFLLVNSQRGVIKKEWVQETLQISHQLDALKIQNSSIYKPLNWRFLTLERLLWLQNVHSISLRYTEILGGKMYPYAILSLNSLHSLSLGSVTGVTQYKRNNYCCPQLKISVSLHSYFFFIIFWIYQVTRLQAFWEIA